MPENTPVPRRRSFLRLAAAAGVVGVAVFGTFFVLRTQFSPAGPTLPESTHAELQRIDGRLAATDSNEAFTGTLVSHYPDGTLRARSAVEDGRLHGVSEGWYPDGSLETREHFREGVSNGLRERWHPNGQLASRAEIHDGRLHGVFRRWHENGQISQVVHMHDGVAHGLSLGYFPSGYLQAQVELDGGDVVRHEYWKDGYRKEPTTNAHNR
jgi:antitoxin component YwqK of YwqJK toxin-antitoxin module